MLQRRGSYCHTIQGEDISIYYDVTIIGILKNTSEYVGVIQNMKNETDHVALSRAFKKFHDFQALKKFLLKGTRIFF